MPQDTDLHLNLVIQLADAFKDLKAVQEVAIVYSNTGIKKQNKKNKNRYLQNILVWTSVNTLNALTGY